MISRCARVAASVIVGALVIAAAAAAPAPARAAGIVPATAPVRATGVVSVPPVRAAGIAIASPVDVSVPLIELGYRDGVTVSGVSPSVTFDLPRYASLENATLQLQLHVPAAADKSSTISVGVNGKTSYTKTLGEIGNDAHITVPLAIPALDAQLFAITVSASLHVAGDPCADNSSRKLFLRIGRESTFVLRTSNGGSAEAFFRDYRAQIAVSGALDDPSIAGVPYQLDRLEPWHRVTSTLVAAPPRTGRALTLIPATATERRGDELIIAPAAFAALPAPKGQTPSRRAGSVAFGELGQHLGSASGTGDLAFDVPLKGSVTGGVPQHLAVHAIVDHSALPAGASGTIQIFVNGILTGARELSSKASLQTVNVDVPRSVVGPSNSVRVVVAPDIPAALCAAGSTGMTATLQDASTFTWSGIDRMPPSIESYITALNGRVAVLVAPEFTRAAFHIMDAIGRLNSGITQLDVKRYEGTVPDGYDFALVFAPPDGLGSLHLPIRAAAPAFRLVNPTDNVDVLTADTDTPLALLQLGQANGTPVLAVTYHGSPAAIDALERVRAAQLATQVADVTVVAGDNVTTYDVGEKLRPSYPGDLTAADIWSRAKLWVALVLLVLIVLGGRYAARRLTGKTI